MKNDYNPNYKREKVYALIALKAVVVNSDDKILLLKRSAKAGDEGRWNLPGGAIEKNEDPIEGIKREIFEETELQASDITPLDTISFREKHSDETEDFVVMIVYTAHTKSDKVVLNWEHDKYIWVHKEEALQMNISDTMKRFIQKTNNE